MSQRLSFLRYYFISLFFSRKASTLLFISSPQRKGGVVYFKRRGTQIFPVKKSGILLVMENFRHFILNSYTACWLTKILTIYANKPNEERHCSHMELLCEENPWVSYTEQTSSVMISSKGNHILITLQYISHLSTIRNFVYRFYCRRQVQWNGMHYDVIPTIIMGQIFIAPEISQNVEMKSSQTRQQQCQNTG